MTKEIHHSSSVLNKVCQKTNFKTTTFVNMIVNALILFTFLTIFYFGYASKLAESSIKDQVDNVLEDSVASGLDKANKQSNGKVHDTILVFKPQIETLKKLVTKNELATKKHNNNLLLVSKLIIGFMVILLVTVVALLYISCEQCAPMKDLLQENIAGFVIVGLIEFVFFKYIISKYAPSLPSHLENSMLESLSNNFD